METTLVTSLTIANQTFGNPREARDVLTRVTDHGPYRLINFETRGQTVEVKVTEAERIALIEALGGKR